SIHLLGISTHLSAFSRQLLGFSTQLLGFSRQLLAFSTLSIAFSVSRAAFCTLPSAVDLLQQPEQPPLLRFTFAYTPTSGMSPAAFQTPAQKKGLAARVPILRPLRSSAASHTAYHQRWRCSH